MAERSIVMAADVALFVPFGRTMCQQIGARSDTNQRQQSAYFHWTK
jgi:hypothetical protein